MDPEEVASDVGGPREAHGAASLEPWGAPRPDGVDRSSDPAAAGSDERLAPTDVADLHGELAAFMRLGAHRRYTPSRGLVEAVVDGQPVLFSTRTGRMYRLNETGYRTWMALRVVTAASAAAMLSAEFDVSMEWARSDVMDFVAALCEAGLLVPAR